ncbi:hypothetical protein DITRI_Ditri16bG0119100 [Diplodiscus trichospermus]
MGVAIDTKIPLVAGFWVLGSKTREGQDGQEKIKRYGVWMKAALIRATANQGAMKSRRIDEEGKRLDKIETERCRESSEKIGVDKELEGRETQMEENGGAYEGKYMESIKGHVQYEEMAIETEAETSCRVMRTNIEQSKKAARSQRWYRSEMKSNVKAPSLHPLRRHSLDIQEISENREDLIRSSTSARRIRITG